MTADSPHPLDALDRQVGRRPVRVALLLVALAVVYLEAHLFLFAESHEVDSYSYWFAARAVALGLDPYDTPALQAMGRAYDLRLVPGDMQQTAIYAYVYPPPFAGLWRPMTLLSPTRAHRVLEVEGTLMLGVMMLLLDRIVRPARHAGLLFALFALGLAVNGPAVSSTRLGQVNAAVFVATLLAVYGYQRRADNPSAAALAAATLVKFTPGLTLLGWGLGDPGARWRRYVVRVTIAALGMVVLSLPLAPAFHWMQFFAALQRGLPWQTEYSWWGWLTLHGGSVPLLLTYRRPLYLVGVALLVAGAAFHLRRLPREEIPLEGAAVATVLGLLLSPLTWQHHFLFFMLPAYAWIARAWAEDRKLRAAVLSFLTLLVLLRLPGAWLGVRPAATLAAFALVTLGPRGGYGDDQ